jgi:homoserine O-acetyltransferase
VIVETRHATLPRPLQLDCGRSLQKTAIAYEAYGELSPERDNAILVCHGLTSTQHAAGRHDPSAKKPGWWDAAIGPGRPFDTSRFCVICSNVLGGFGGSSGPASEDPDRGVPFGLSFPVVTIGDMVEAQAGLADYLGIERFCCVAGGCMGGFQALEWMRRFPARLGSAMVISAGARVSTHTIALWKVLSDAIRGDPAWNGGDYYGGAAPEQGMALAARIGALFWMSREVMAQRFGLGLADGRELSYSLSSDFDVERFLDGIGRGAAAKIDANSLMYLMRAMTYFDLTHEQSRLADVFADAPDRTLLVSYANDWRYPVAETTEIEQALREVGAAVEHRVFASEFGHGAFIYDFADLGAAISQFLDGG